MGTKGEVNVAGKWEINLGGVLETGLVSKATWGMKEWNFNDQCWSVSLETKEVSFVKECYASSIKLN